MLERHIVTVRSDDPGLEEPAETRERLRAAFPPGATRRMTQLGMLIGSVLGPFEPRVGDAIIYATRFGESRALEAYLESFPFASPTLFQTSIHPGGVQQGLISRQQAVREVVPMSGDRFLAVQSVLAALLSPVERVLYCGGEERGTWLLEHGVASDRAFAFAMALVRGRPAEAMGRIAVHQLPDVEGTLTLAAFFDLVHRREAYDGPAAPGWRLELAWESSSK